LGEAVDEETQTSKNTMVRVFHDPMESTTGWAAGGNVIDNGTVTGTMVESGDYFTYSSLGSGANWHGPALKKSLTTPLDNFRVEAWMKLKTSKNVKEQARVEVILLDVNSNVIGKLSMRDSYTTKRGVKAVLRIGPADNAYYLLNGEGPKTGYWTDFYGKLRLEKDGKWWYAYVGVLGSNGKYSKTWSAKYYDKNNKWTADLAQVVVTVNGYGTSPVPTPDNLFVSSIQIFSKSTLGAQEVPVIASAGDVIEINHLTKEVLLNGEDYREVLDPSSNLFALSNGATDLGFEPFDAAAIELSYQGRWK